MVVGPTLPLSSLLCLLFTFFLYALCLHELLNGLGDHLKQRLQRGSLSPDPYDRNFALPSDDQGCRFELYSSARSRSAALAARLLFFATFATASAVADRQLTYRDNGVPLELYRLTEDRFRVGELS